jgi:hypothetical protein
MIFKIGFFFFFSFFFKREEEAQGETDEMLERAQEIGCEFGDQSLKIEFWVADMWDEDQSFHVILLVVGGVESEASSHGSSGMVGGEQEFEGSEGIVQSADNGMRLGWLMVVQLALIG